MGLKLLSLLFEIGILPPWQIHAWRTQQRFSDLVHWPRWPPSWNLPKIRSYQKVVEIKQCWHDKTYNIVLNTLLPFVNILHCFHRKGWKSQIFIQKWLDHMLLMASFLVTIVTDSHYTCTKMCLRNMYTATEIGRCCCQIPWNIFHNNLWGDATPPPCLHTQGFCIMTKYPWVRSFAFPLITLNI